MFDFNGKMKDYSELSMMTFKAYLSKKYGNNMVRDCYSPEDLWKKPESFVKDYPVVLSTTHSLKASLSSNFMYDYIIVDEASQVDLVSGALA